MWIIAVYKNCENWELLKVKTLMTFPVNVTCRKNLFYMLDYKELLLKKGNFPNFYWYTFVREAVLNFTVGPQKINKCRIVDRINTRRKFHYKNGQNWSVEIRFIVVNFLLKGFFLLFFQITTVRLNEFFFQKIHINMN